MDHDKGVKILSAAFFDEIEKSAALARGAMGVAKLVGRAITGKGPGLTGAKTRAELAREALKGTKGFAKKVIKEHPGKAGLAAGAAGTYAVTR